MCGNQRRSALVFKARAEMRPTCHRPLLTNSKALSIPPKANSLQAGQGHAESTIRRVWAEWERASVTCTRDSALSYGSFGRGLYYLQLGHNVLLSRWTEADRPHWSVSSSRVRRRPCVREDVFLCRWAVQYGRSKLLDFGQRHMRVKMTVPQRWELFQAQSHVPSRVHICDC